MLKFSTTSKDGKTVYFFGLSRAKIKLTPGDRISIRNDSDMSFEVEVHKPAGLDAAPAGGEGGE